MDFHDGCFCFRTTEQVEAARQDGMPVRCAPDLGMPCACTASILNEFPVQEDPLFDVTPSLDWNSSSTAQPHDIPEQEADSSGVPNSSNLSKPSKRPQSKPPPSTSEASPSKESPCCNCPCEKLHGYVVKRQKCCGETCQCIDGNCNCPADPSGEKCCDEIEEFSDFLRNYGSSLLQNISTALPEETPLVTPLVAPAVASCSSKKSHVHSSSCGGTGPVREPPPTVPPANTSSLIQPNPPSPREVRETPPSIPPQITPAILQSNPSQTQIILPVEHSSAAASANGLHSLALPQPQESILPITFVPPQLQLDATPVSFQNGTTLLPHSSHNIPAAPLSDNFFLQSMPRTAPSTTSVTQGTQHSSTASFPQSANSHSLPVTTVFAMPNQIPCTSKKSKGNPKRKSISVSGKIELQGSSLPQPELMKCTDCEASFATQDELEYHAAKKHRKNRPYACNQCGSTFLFKQNRDRHIVEVHQGKRPHKCPRRNCKAAFKNSSGLKQHMRTVHDKQRPFKCDQCESSFGQRNHLTQHVLVVHEHRKLFECEECGTSFSNRGNLNQHIRRRHSKVAPKSLASKKKSATAAISE